MRYNTRFVQLPRSCFAHLRSGPGLRGYCRFLDGVVDTDESVILGMDRVKKIREQVAAGESWNYVECRIADTAPLQ